MLIGKVPVIFKSSVRIPGGGHDEFVLILHESRPRPRAEHVNVDVHAHVHLLEEDISF
jgi:hypothetical protein